MPAALVLLVVPAVLTALLWRGLRDVFDQPLLLRENVSHRQVPTAVGAVAVLSVVVCVALVQIDAVVGPGLLPSGVIESAGAGPSIVVGFAFLGLIDDLLGSGRQRGFAGHLGALLHGRVTTGLVKLLGGAALGVTAALTVQVSSPAPRMGWLLDALLVALAANLANLLDRAPGRLMKVSLGCLAGLLLLGGSDGDPIVPVAAILFTGGVVGLAHPELRERSMLGDTGANALGAALGIGALQLLSWDARLVLLVVLLVLNALSEIVSFSQVIERTPLLRHLDRLGRSSAAPPGGEESQ